MEEAREREAYEAWRDEYDLHSNADAWAAWQARANLRAQQAATAAPEVREALAELVALKDLKDEVMRRKQRRSYVFRRDEDDVRAVDAMEDDYKRRQPLAWAAARAAIAPLAAPEQE